MKIPWNKIILFGFGIGLCVLSGCEPDPGVPVRTVSSASQATHKRSSIDRSQLEVADGNWKPVRNWEVQLSPRNPFRGFADSMIAEMLHQQQLAALGNAKEQLPEQLYSVKDYKLMGIITGTAEPKAFVIDPAGNRFILRRGSLIGNNNGSVSSIRRDGVEVFEMVSGEGVYYDIQLYEKKDSDITFTLQ